MKEEEKKDNIVLKKKRSARNVDALNHLGLIDDQEKITELNKVAENFSIAITPQILNLIDDKNSNDPLARQFVPGVEELDVEEQELADPIGESTHTIMNGLVHRYPDRVLLKPVNVCPVYCRFCFRRETIGPGNEALSHEDLTRAYQYIASHKEIWEVILTGGDPLIMKPKKIAEIINSLVAIENVAVIRIHTRVPAVDPESISTEMVNALKVKKPVYVVLHVNHATEFTEAVQTACARLIDAGIPMLSQSVLIKGVNDDVKSLSDLMRAFVVNRIKPYYLHQCDLVKGTGHFRVAIKKGQELMQALRGNFSGLCQPTYVLDIPGGYGKVPITQTYITGSIPSDQLYENDYYLVEDYKGNQHHYRVSIKKPHS